MSARKCDDNLLRLLYPTKMPLAEVAKRVGYNNGCNVTRRAVELGLPKRTDAAETFKRDAQICRAVENGVALQEVANLHGLSRQRIVAIVRGQTRANEASNVRVKAWSVSPAAIKKFEARA